MKLFNFKLTPAEKRKIFNWKKLVIASLGALATHFIVLAPFQGLWEGWMVVISTIVGIIVGEWLN